MKGISKIATVTLLGLVYGCQEIFLGPEPPNTPTSNFDVFWQTFDQNYSYFSLKGVDWDSVYQVYRPQIDDNTTDDELFDILVEIGELLRDGHYVITNGAEYYYSYYGSSLNKIPLQFQPAAFYLENERSAGNYISYATVKDTQLGYLRIASFGGEDDEYAVIDQALQNLSSTTGLILDVRTTGGGSTELAETIAGRFADQTYLYRHYKYRNGENWNDYTDPIAAHVVPQGETNYLKPIIVITDRRCLSACEGFVLMLKALPTVRTLGDTTFGGTARPITQELPNGWNYRVSTWFVTEPNGEVVEGQGIAPDVLEPYVQLDSFDVADNAMDRAIELLSE
ncbi:MAG: S41 family peptidase [Tunicatimonas sp.]|uniref:S41 family peptidase n=1 Tax=Tunicatimonas sp. TaxID=1940096 RepID=UPI003C739CB7